MKGETAEGGAEAAAAAVADAEAVEATVEEEVAEGVATAASRYIILTACRRVVRSPSCVWYASRTRKSSRG
jgi:hypothetical protein